MFLEYLFRFEGFYNFLQSGEQRNYVVIRGIGFIFHCIFFDYFHLFASCQNDVEKEKKIRETGYNPNFSMSLVTKSP